jgi:aminocarboxymuconate-semialdehyde decarboxylase
VAKRELGDETFWPIYKMLEELGVPMFVHPHHVAGLDRLMDFYLNNLIGNPLDTTIAATRLIFSGTLEKFPKLKVVLAHGGGQFPFIFGRIEHGYKVRPEPKEKVHKRPYPYDMGDPNPVRTVSELSGIKAADRRKIMRENAIALFGLKVL